MDTKLTDLLQILKNMESAVLAYSGGVDSTFLLKALHLSGLKALAVTAVSDIIPERDVLNAQTLAEEIGIDHVLIETDEMSTENFVKNPPERCYYCKDILFRTLSERARNHGYLYVIDGSTIDDLSDYRPGMKAAREHDIKSPLIEAGLSKEKIRELSRHLNLSTWNKPSSPCFATRFPYGHRITKKALQRVAKAEDFLKSVGFEIVRVRDHGHLARIEISEDSLELVLSSNNRKRISEVFKTLGYDFISLDLEGYRSGSMNVLIR